MVKLFILFILTSCTLFRPAPTPVKDDVVEIYEINPNKQTALTRQHMFHLLQVYDLTPFLFTKKINVQSNVQPRSHPVLTLNTSHADSPNLILALWLHEEFHWWANSNSGKVRSAIKELKLVYPTVPVDGRMKSAKFTYLHLIVCYLEYKTLIMLLGEEEAKTVLKKNIREDQHYPWVYNQVMYQNLAIKKIIEKNKLMPNGLH